MSPLSDGDSARSRRASRWHGLRFSRLPWLTPSPSSKIYIQYINNNVGIKLLVIFANCQLCQIPICVSKFSKNHYSNSVRSFQVYRVTHSYGMECSRLIDILKPEWISEEFLMSRPLTHHMPSGKTLQMVPNMYEERKIKTGELTLAPKSVFWEWHFPQFCENRNLGLHFHKTMRCHVASGLILSHVQYLLKRKLWLLNGGNRFVTRYRTSGLTIRLSS